MSSPATWFWFLILLFKKKPGLLREMVDPRTRVGNIQNKLGESYSNGNNEVLPPRKPPQKQNTDKDGFISKEYGSHWKSSKVPKPKQL